MELLENVLTMIGLLIEAVGVVIIVVGCALTTIRFLRKYGPLGFTEAYSDWRRHLARAILLGLEFLVAGDIIRTVIIGHSLSDVAILSLIVLIRVFLSFTLFVEIEGRWPWQPGVGKTKKE